MKYIDLRLNNSGSYGSYGYKRPQWGQSGPNKDSIMNPLGCTEHNDCTPTRQLVNKRHVYKPHPSKICLNFIDKNSWLKFWKFAVVNVSYVEDIF